jgi:hypothetical protein
MVEEVWLIQMLGIEFGNLASSVMFGNLAAPRDARQPGVLQDVWQPG